MGIVLALFYLGLQGVSCFRKILNRFSFYRKPSPDVAVVRISSTTPCDSNRDSEVEITGYPRPPAVFLHGRFSIPVPVWHFFFRVRKINHLYF